MTGPASSIRSAYTARAMAHLAVQWSLAVLLAAAPAAKPAAPKADSVRYQVELDRLVRCQPATGSASGPAPSDRIWVGFAVTVRSKAKGLFVTARDFSLEKQGIVLQPRHVNAPVLEGCLPLLRQRQVDPNDDPNQGFVLFEVPARFRNDDVPLTLAYQPTRWGGAARVELVVPSCLDQCDSTRTRPGQSRETRQPAIGRTP
jgi:hypothetical protein